MFAEVKALTQKAQAGGGSGWETCGEVERGDRMGTGAWGKGRENTELPGAAEEGLSWGDKLGGWDRHTTICQIDD